MFQLRSFMVTALTLAIVCFGGQGVRAEENSSENITSYDDNIILSPFLNVYHGGSDTLVLTRMSVYGAIYSGMRF